MTKIIDFAIKKAKSDSDLIPSSSEDLHNKPECLNLINILSACIDKDIKMTLKDYSGKEYSSLKKDLTFFKAFLLLVSLLLLFLSCQIFLLMLNQDPPQKR